MPPFAFRALIFLFSLLFSAGLFAQGNELYSRARIWTPGTSITELAALGICVDHGHYRKGAYLECDFSENEITLMRQAGFQVDVLIEDVGAFYAKRGQESADINVPSNKTGICGAENTTNYLTPLGFSLGSMGGYFTYQEMLDHLDSMHAQFPDLITARQPIDTFLSHQGRPIYYLRITSQANPGVNKPQVLYTALHHAREPASLSQLIYYMYYLLENYGTDTEVTYLLNNAELVFVPCINPDGYLRNQQTDPNGGGNWRKNRRDNGNNRFGVDLNRNYGYEWGYDDTGSSPNPSNDTYRGPAGFSEPETRAIRYLCLNNDFKVALNHHTYGNLLVYPWGYEPSLFTPDSTVFVSLAEWMTAENAFVYGTGDQTVGYTTNGDSDDWMYGEQVLKGKIFSFTPESGTSSDGFWPAPNRIIPICIDNLHQNLTAARFVLNYGVVQDINPSILPTISGNLEILLTRMGLDDTAPLTVSLEPASSNVTSVSAPQVITNLASFDSDVLSFSYTLNNNTQPGDWVQFRLSVSNGVVTQSDTLLKVLGPVAPVFVDSAISAALWAGGGWGTTATTFVSSPFSFTDSPNGDYQPGTNSIYLLDTVIDLTQATFGQLQFHARWAIEPGYDYAQVEASVQGSGIWQPLCGKYTVLGNTNQALAEPLYDGFSNGWVREEIDLGTYLGQKMQVRFQLRSDNFVEEDGFYFDDFKVLALVTDTTDSLTAIAPLASPTLALYPNPASDRVVATFGATATISTIVCYNLLGEEVLHINVPMGSTQIHINTQDLPSGIYVVQHLGIGQAMATKRLVIAQ